MTTATETVLGIVPVNEDREIRISRIEADDVILIRVAPYLLATNQALSGIIFPERVLPMVADTLSTVSKQLKAKR